MAADTVILSWGKCSVYVKKSSDTNWKKFPPIVENSTTLTPTAGDTLKAYIEGGEAEAIKNKANTYELVYQSRVVPGRTFPIEHKNGVVDGEYSVAVVPEDTEALGVVLDRTAASVLDGIFSSENGIVNEYHHNGLLPTDESNIVKMKKITVEAVTGSEGEYTLTMADA